MKLTSVWISALLLLVLVFQACNDPSLIGSDLFEDDLSNASFVDTFSLQATTLRADSVRTYSKDSRGLNSNPFGKLKDPVMGTVAAGLYFRVRSAQRNPGFSIGKLDSVVLMMPFDTSSFYGNTSQTFPYQLYQLDDQEKLNTGSDYYSNNSLKIRNTPIADNSFVPNGKDSIFVKEPFNAKDSAFLLKPHLRLRLSEPFISAFFSTDTAVFKSDSAFLAKFSGFYLKPSGETEGMVSLDLKDELARMSVYFHQNDTTFRREDFYIDYIYFSEFKHDFKNAPVESFIGKASLGDSMVFLQSMEGLRVKVDLNEQPEFREVIVNKAELELTVINHPLDATGRFAQPDQLVVYKMDTDSTLTLLNDVTFSSSNLSEYFGGTPKVNSGGLTKYKLNLSSYMEDFLQGKETGRFFIEILNRSESAARSILAGAKSKTHPIKLNLYYTESTN